MELGSEYNLSLTDLTVKENNIFRYLSGYQNVYYFDSGRSALKDVVKGFAEDDEVLLPEFICESVTNCFEGATIKFYKLHQDFTIDFEDLKSKCSSCTKIIFLMHYFGALQPKEDLQKLKQLASDRNVVIIEDTTHSIFSKTSTVGDYMVCSIRKWLPIPKGGVLYYNTNKFYLNAPTYVQSKDNERSYGMVLKDLSFTRNLDVNSVYREIFAQCEERLDQQKDIYMLSDFSRFIASCVDIGQLQYLRKRNYGLLAQRLLHEGFTPVMQIHAEETPLVYLLRVRERNILRAYLMDYNIYSAVHWPFDGIQAESRRFAAQNAEELISLPIDQRYDEAHINYLADVLAGYGR